MIPPITTNRVAIHKTMAMTSGICILRKNLNKGRSKIAIKNAMSSGMITA
jgi:hypothetical protein